MKNFFAALLVTITLLVAAPVSAEIQTFEGIGEYVINGEDVVSDV